MNDNNKLPKLKIALVHEFLDKIGGAERVLFQLAQDFPGADIFCLIKDQKLSDQFLPHHNVYESKLAKLPKSIKRNHKLLLPFYKSAIEGLKLNKYDLIISDSASFGKGIRKREGQIHICYCHTPPRFIWDYREQYLKEIGLRKSSSKIVNRILDKLKVWDYQKAQDIDYFIANSKHVAQRIKKFYRRSSKVIYPPVNVGQFEIAKKPLKNYFLIAGRLSAYKKIDIAIKVFNHFRIPLYIIGEGSDRERLEKLATNNIKFLGSVDEKKLAYYYQNCLALIFQQEEDFGIVPVEAMASGRPVIAYAKGGALETIVNHQTGLLFNKQSEKDLLLAIENFCKIEPKFDPKLVKKHANKFSAEIFNQRIKKFVLEKIKC